MKAHVWMLLGAMALGLAACEEKKSGFVVGQPKAADCDLSLDKLAGTEWVMLKAIDADTEKPDPSARAKFYMEDGHYKLKYNVASVSDMYTYDCKVNEAGDELTCKEEPKVKDWCQALVAGGKETCTYDDIKKIDPDVTQAQFDEGWKKAQEVINRFKDDPEKWKKFVFQNNNLGNKLQGLFYAKIDKRHCWLRVTDNYMTIYNGKRVEDSNPVGTNPFVKNDLGELLWEHCENREDLIARPEADYPKDPDRIGHMAHYQPGQEFHVWYLAKDGREYKEGCDNSFDVWINAKPYKKGLKPEIVENKRKKELRWHVALKFDEPSATPQGETITFVRHTTCDGKTETAVSCAAVRIE